jgi:2',3'-cyclic-nucleotide 2'-phosphodiesterase (5'-nucleotidase family)
MTLVRTEPWASATPGHAAPVDHPVPIAHQDAPPALTEAPSVEQTVQAWHNAGHSRLARALGEHPATMTLQRPSG